MKAFVIKRYGKNERGEISNQPEPELKDTDVLVEVHASSVNPLDSKIKSGEFKAFLPYKMPLIMGNDVAGVVVGVGSRVSHFKVGDEVYARPPHDRIGSFAERIAMKESAVALKPTRLTMEEAAAIPLVGTTAWQAFVDRAKLKKGQRVLIHAGSGGVGSFAIQLAKHLGAHVAATTSTANVAMVQALGADVVIDYKTTNFDEVLQGYDVVLNTLGPDVLKRSVKVLKPGGKLISISGPPDPDTAKQLGLNGFLKIVMTLLSYSIRKKVKRQGASYQFLFMEANGRQLGEITSLIESGIIQPVIDRVFPLDATADALDYLDTGRAKGKVVISVK